MRPKKAKEELRVPLNCLVAPGTLTAIVAMVKEEGVSQGVIVDRAVALRAYGEEVEAVARIPKAKKSAGGTESWQTAASVVVEKPRAQGRITGVTAGKMCEHGKGPGYHCGLCGGLAKV